MKKIEVKNCSFSYDNEKDAVKNISFSIEEGSYTTIIGHNGSGKSTIAKLLIGLLEKRNGEIIIDGLELNEKNLDEIRSKIGIVFQNPDNQFIGATVADDIAFGLENHLVESKEMDKIIQEFAKRVNMQEYLNREPQNLSGGQKQRVAIAGVLAMNPDIIIFDESTSMLDPKGKEEINELIREINELKKMTVISITHDIEEVVHSDHVIVMEKGKVAYDGSKEELFTNEYQKYNLTKPTILRTIDYINEKTKRNISYQNYTLDDLLKSLKDGDFNE